MPSTYDRRTLLRITADGALVGLAGCLGTESDERSTATAQPTTRTQAETTTGTETSTTTTVETYTCDEQGIAPDVEILNNRDETVSVEVNIEDRTADSVLLDETYDVPAGGKVEEEDYVFSSVAPETDHTIWAAATVGTETAEADVTVVARNAVNYTTTVRVTENGITVFDHHFDPGVRSNFDCYPRD